MKEIFKNIWQVLEKKERKKLLFLSMLDIVISLADIFSLVALLWIIQFYVNPSPNKSSFLPVWLNNKNSPVLIGIFLAFFSLKNLAGLFTISAQYRFISSVAIRISRDNLVKFQQINYEDFVINDSSGYIRSIAFQPFEFCQHLMTGTQQIITQLFLVSFTVLAILFFNVKLFLTLFVLLLPPVIIVFYVIKKRLSGIKKKLQTSNQLSFQYLMDALKGWVEGNIFDRNRFFQNRFLRHRQEFSKNLFNSLSLQSMPGRVIEIFAILGLFILVTLSISTGNTGNSAFITIGAFVAAAYKIIPGIVKIINVSSQMKAYDFVFNDIADTQNQQIQKSENNNKGIDNLEYKNIFFSYGDTTLIKDVSCAINRGDFVGITGLSGKGKTTFLNITLGFLKPQKGEVFFNGQAICNGTTKKFWSNISYVKQQSFLIHDTITRNITFEESVSDKKRLDNALNISGLDKFLQEYTNGTDKIISENGKNISGGQQQRIAIARALYKKDADLFLMDEPFNELDEESTTTILEHLKDISRKGKMVILITHDKKSLTYCNKIISLDEQY
ncbi:MAG TPA: ABC transporter ATP-binding protein [Chitinophagaceae bacterium]|nr:ABC transporter ATP-binding protein [Chitinophagaceae bacterium]